MARIMAAHPHGLEIIVQDTREKWTGRTDPGLSFGGLGFINLKQVTARLKLKTEIQVKDQIKTRAAVRATQEFKITQEVQANGNFKRKKPDASQCEDKNQPSNTNQQQN